jgi:3-phenylpropionate/trans-cinnamate dioxygenase ferredoxin reductase component
MLDYRYLIIGGGMTADAAVRGIRKVDPNGSVGIISAEAYPPYNRPPLTKALWKGKSVDTIWRGTEKRATALHLERRARTIQSGVHLVTDDHGEEYRYEKLLIATGGKPRRLAFGGQEILYYRNLAHYYALRELANQKKSFLVIGGGFIGSELAAALRMNHKEVTQIIRRSGIGAGMFPADLVDFLGEYFTEKGVRVVTGAAVNGSEQVGPVVQVSLEDGQQFTADAVVAGLGIQPNSDLAESAGIEVSDGITVNETLQTNIPDIYAAGDVASFYNPALGMRLRMEHEDNANHMGEVAGQNMAGLVVPYTYLPYFYSDLFELGYESIGWIDASLNVIADWQEPYRKGVLYYLDGNRVRGVVLWNVWGKIDAARDLISRGESVSPTELFGLLK